MKITAIAQSKNLTAAKLERLTELASRLGKLRAELWNEFGSIKGVNLTHRQIRDNWLAHKAKVIVCEDLTATFKSSSSKSMGTNQRAKCLTLDNFDHYFRNRK